MDPRDFFETAKLLKTHSSEEHLRTSVGRSYYAAFLYFREYLKKLGLEKVRNPRNDAHAFVINCLQFSGVTEGCEASTRLKDLQQRREDADYKLEKTVSPEDAGDTLVLAEKVIDKYHTDITSEKEARLLSGARRHAKFKHWI